jgi:hypothetical protein
LKCRGVKVSASRGTIYSEIQALFKRGLVIVVGSGASSGFGLPGMGALAKFLLEHVPPRIATLPAECQEEWKRISSELQDDAGLESALGSETLPELLVDLVAELVAECIQAFEQVAMAEILGSESVSSFGRLFDHILKTAPVADVITTNYDRLVEVHAARAGVRVDSMYYGHTVGRLDATLSREELYRAQTAAGRPRSAILETRPHVRLSKPHGSLDWFTHNDQHFRSDLILPGARRIIAPGGNKYRLGYEAPFDVHRNRANAAIDQASALLFVGYGFNDEHLQTHIRPKFPLVPVVILSHQLTSSALEFLALNATAIGIESGADERHCRVVQGSTVLDLEVPLWDLEHLLKEVLAI